MEDVESVIQQMCSGDSGAFDIIFRRFDRAVYRTAFLITGDKEIAGEVMQEVFLDFVINLNHMDLKRKIFSSLFLHMLMMTMQGF